MAQPVTQMAKKVIRTFRELHGVVISAGLMDKTVKVRVGGQKWNSFLKKFFDDPKTHLVHDPNNSLRLGDVVAITPGWRTSKSKRHVVKHIIAPGSGVPIEGRAPVPTEEERLAQKEAQRMEKIERRTAKKMITVVEQQLGIAEQLLKKTRKEFALRARLMGVNIGGNGGGGGGEEGKKQAGDVAPQ
ncbi:nucleic acid-binding protein [Parathielavia appendiculata]|uniref:Nucleic acid-binding protein n=1 Tax=Parathielavia appendiculata TaxID=2587402 RepID=A0AAN6U0K8_9PEZI|nr:nucleic acid-binding protein [Parathielavia appendiculata]